MPAPSRGGRRGGAKAGDSPRGARRKLTRVTDLLERTYGVPSVRRERDLMGSLVGTILSQNTTDVNSRRAYLSLRERFDDWTAVERAPARSIEAAIRSGGLAGTKARRLKRLLADVRRETGGHDLGFLRRMDTDEVIRYLEGFEGVGPKTASCVALFALGRDIVPVDTHVHRVVGRLGIVGRPTSPAATFAALRGLTPEGRGLSLHVNLIRLGRAICRPRRPRCGECPLRRVCETGRGSRGSGPSGGPREG